MISIILAIVLGVITGIFFENNFCTSHYQFLISFGLCLLLFFIGVDIGRTKNTFLLFKQIPKKTLFLPFIIISGSLFGGYFSHFFTSLTYNETILISSGMGWYSYSAIELSKYSSILGSLAFSSNVIRELLSFIIIPIVAKYIGSYESISVAGATSMDSLLPVISRYNPPNIAIVSFYSGLIITIIIPLLLPLLIKILY